MKRIIAGLVLILLTLAAGAPASASEITWTKAQQVTRNQLSRMTGTLVHQVIQGYALAAFTRAAPMSGYWGPIPDLLRFDYPIPLAPSNWKVKGGMPESDGANGKADIMAQFNYRPVAPNICEVYEIKPWGQTYSMTYNFLHLAQLQGYMGGIDQDQSIPCRSHAGVSWTPAVFPAWHEVPEEYTSGLGKLGMKLQITTTCSLITDEMGGSGWDNTCGMIYYRFQWKNHKDNSLVKSVGVRSKAAFDILNQWLETNFGKSELQREAAGEDVGDLVAKLEVNMDHNDAFQQFIDVRYPDGEVDPDVHGLVVVDNWIDFAAQAGDNSGWFVETVRSLWDSLRFIIPGARPACNMSNPQGEENLPLCG